MESASNSADSEAKWRAGFRQRIWHALEFLRGQNGFGKTQSRHFNAFNETYLTDQRFRREVGKLSPFETEVFCISSTARQLEVDSVYFTAAEVKQALALKLLDQRRGEIRQRILSDGHSDLPQLYQGNRESAVPDEDSCIIDVQRWIQASLGTSAIQRLLENMRHEYAIIPPPHQANGVTRPTMQTKDSRVKLLPSTSPTGSACASRSLLNVPHSNEMPLSISLRMNGMEASLCQQPNLCEDALVLGSEFLDQVTTVRDLGTALTEPRPRKSMLSFLRFVFESGPVLDQLAMDRKLTLRKMNSISLALCSATYTENMILKFSEGRWRALYSNCCEFLGGPGNVAASLPVDLVNVAVTAKLIPEDHVAYAMFLKGLEEYQRARKATPPSLLTCAERPSGFGTSMTWPQEHVAAILPLNPPSLVMLGQLARLYKETGRDIPFPDDVAAAFSAASKSAPLDERMQILDIAAEMITNSTPTSARATIVHQRSVALRLLGNSNQAEHEILSFLRKTSNVPELLLKSLKLSLVESRVYQFRYHEANEIARSIGVGGDANELHLLWDHIYCVGRIMRGRGEFESAKVCFERCCASTDGIRPSKVILTQCALADIYCELDHISGDCEHSYLLQAESVLEHALKTLGEANIKGRRRLLLSLSEVCIRHSQVHEATTILEGLITLFDGLKCPDIIDRLGHVRLYMTLARSCPFGQSMTHWREAQRLNKAYNPDEEEVFTCAVIYLNMSWLSYCEGQSNQGQETYSRASEVLKRRRPEFLLPGIGTYVFQDTLYKLQTKIGAVGGP